MATDPREAIIAASQFGAGSTTWAPATWHVGLSKTTSNDDGSNFTEPVGFNYARVAKTNNTTNWPAPTTLLGVTTLSNGTAITFPVPSGLWGLIVEVGFFTASTGGVPQFVKELDVPITVQSGNSPVEFAIGQLVLPWD